MYKLLLVDDDKALLDKFYEIVDWNRYGFEVVAKLGNGLEAFEYTKTNQVDVVVTDIRMPKMDGIELAGKLHENYPDIKVVFVSAFCDLNYARQAIKYGVVDYIGKPVSLEEVEETLQKLYTKLGNITNGGEQMNLRLIEEREELFGRMFNSKVFDVDNFKEELADVQILYRSLYSKCAFAYFEIIGMEKQVKEKWKNNRKKLIETISTAVCIDTASYYAIRLNFSENVLSVLYISKSSDAISDKCTDMVLDNLWSMYNLIAVNETFLQFSSLDTFKEELSTNYGGKLKALSNKILVRSDEQMLYEVEKYVNEHYVENITIGTIANQYHFNEQYFGKMFKKAKGKSFFEYLNEVRIEKAKPMLAVGEKVETIWSMVGFANRRNFDKQFLYYTGETPAQYRKKMLGERK